MVRLPKIAIGTNKRKAYFDLSHDVETTADFGFCQPTIVRHMNAGSSSTLKTGIGVRLAPLPCPTFGRIKLKTFNTLVPMREVFEAFDYFQKGTSVSSAVKDYIPKYAPILPAFTLRDFILLQSLFEFKKLTDSTGDFKTDVDCDAFANISICAPNLRYSNLVDSGQTVEIEGVTRKIYDFVDTTLVPIGRCFDSTENSFPDTVTQNLFNSLSTLLFTQGSSGYYINTLDVFDGDSNIGLDGAFNGSIFDVNIFSSVLTGIRDFRLNTVRRTFYCNRATSSAFDMSLGEYRTISLNFVDSNGDNSVVQVRLYVLANWTKRGQRLFKVLNAIGLRGFMYNDDVDMCKFYAFYKAWFDSLNPGRNQQWRETSAYKLIHTYYDLNEQLYALMLNQTGDYYPLSKQKYQEIFNQFLVDVTNCCYVMPVDNFTAATPDNLLQRDSIDVQTPNFIDISSGYPQIVGGDNINNYPHIQSSISNSTLNAARVTNIDQSLNGLVISSLLRLYKLANKNSVIGARIEDYLKTKYGYTIARSHILNGDEMNIKIDEIFANAGTTENRLGELGGRGSNDNVKRGECKFDVDENSIFVQFVTVVPWGDYVQGNIRAKVTKNDFYQEVYDSLGKEKYSMSELMARCSDLTYQPNMASYGSVPQYWREKVQNSLHNGAFALPSQRAQVIPYSLDRLFNETELRVVADKATHYYGMERVAGTVLTPSEEMRYIGRTPDYGNYDRIFFDNTGYFDNFILHIVQDWDYYATMKPISQSFDTFDDDNDSSSTSVSAS